MRILIDIDWTKFGKTEKMSARAGTDGDDSVSFVGGDKKMVVKLRAVKIYKPELAGFKGFIENNGFVSMRAANFIRQMIKPGSQWKVISDFGYTGNVLEAFPLLVKSNTPTDTDSIRRFNSFVEYDFYTFTSAAPGITIFTLPTHELNNNYSSRYALSIDDGRLAIIDFKTFGRSEEWKQNVLRNRAEKKIDMPHLNAGKHRLKIYCIDPGAMIDEIRIDLGGLKKAYSVIPETRMGSAW